MTLLISCSVVVILATLMTALLRRYALARSLLDIPNARSSHSLPTPRGGGVAIVGAFLLGLTGIFLSEQTVSFELFWALIGAGTAIAVLGFLDDHGHIAARWRLLGHFIAAGWALFWLRGLPPLDMGGHAVD